MAITELVHYFQKNHRLHEYPKEHSHFQRRIHQTVNCHDESLNGIHHDLFGHPEVRSGLFLIIIGMKSYG